MRIYRRRTGTKTGLACAIAIIILCMLPALAIAKEGDEVASASQQDLSNLNIEDLLNVQITSASKKTEKSSEAPASVTVITHEQIERYGYRSLGDALRSVVGFYVTSDRNYDYLGVRGYSMPGDYNTRVLILVDGVRLNDPVYDQAPIGQDLPVDIRSVERIEVIKGPGSALWGDNAMLAVINVITRKAEDINGSRLSQDLGAQATQESFFEFGNSSDEMQLAGSVASTKSDGQQSIYFPEFNGAATNNGIAQNVDGESAQRGYISGSYGKLKLFCDAGQRWKDIPTASFGTVFDNSGNWTQDTYSLLSLNYETKCLSTRNDVLSVQLYSSRYDYRGNYIYDEGKPSLVTNVDTGDADWYGTEARYTLNVNQRLSVTSGFEYRVNRLWQENHDAAPYYHEVLERQCHHHRAIALHSGGLYPCKSSATDHRAQGRPYQWNRNQREPAGRPGLHGIEIDHAQDALRSGIQGSELL